MIPKRILDAYNSDWGVSVLLRCGGLAADCVFSNFSLVLTEEPIEEPDIINMGVIYGQSKANGTEEQEDDLSDIDLDDWLYFPPEEKSIDISKNIRDMVHLEITINGLCDPQRFVSQMWSKS